MVPSGFANETQIGGALLRGSPSGPSAVMLCSTIGIPDHYGKGATVETRQLCLFLGDQAPAQTSDGP